MQSTMRTVDVLLPVRGRAAETLALIPRLRSVAAYPFTLTVIVDADKELDQLLSSHIASESLIINRERQGYWKCLSQAAQKTRGDFIATLANDLLPGCEWLKRAVDAHAAIFGSAEGLLGFNDGIHSGQHAAHFLVNRSMLRRWYGEDYFPVMYDHTWGDTEIVRRALEEGRFAVGYFAILFHNHPYNGKLTDAVYAEGQILTDADKATFDRRAANGWRSQ